MATTQQHLLLETLTGMESKDGAEYFGFFYESSNLWCHYTVQLVYVCDDAAGQAANATYLNVANVDSGTDPTNPDSDGDGMPDGWEIQHRRWVGMSFTGGNNWSLDPLRADDANWDADGDGLPNLCEYQWSIVRNMGLAGELLELYGESPESVEQWALADPNAMTLMAILYPTAGNLRVSALGIQADWASTLSTDQMRLRIQMETATISTMMASWT